MLADLGGECCHKNCFDQRPLSFNVIVRAGHLILMIILDSSGHSKRSEFWRYEVQAVSHGEHGPRTLQEARDRTLLGSGS